MRISITKKFKKTWNKKKTINSLKTLIIVALATVIYYPPYLQGLFFEKHILLTGIFVFSLFIIFCIYRLVKKDYTMLKTPIEYLSLAFAVVYFISIFNAIHTRSAIIELLKYCMNFAIFYMITDVVVNKKLKLIFLWTITASAVGVSIIGLDSAIGGNLVRTLNKLFSSLGVQGDMFFGLFVDNRINSTLQYPNALASYVMAVFFVVIGLILSSEKLWVKAIGGICAYILFLTFMLTESKGAQLIFPVTLIIFLLVTPRRHKIRATVNVVLFVIPAVCLSFIISPYLSETAFSMTAFLMIISGIILAGNLAIFTNRISELFQRINWKVYLVSALILIVLVSLSINYVLNSSIPIEISHSTSETDNAKLVSRDIHLAPGKDYLLVYTAETRMVEEKPYAYYTRISSKNMNDILFYRDTIIKLKPYNDNNSKKEILLQFHVPDDSSLVNITFVNYYKGTSVKLDNARIVDPETGKTVKEIILKNKYNLDSIIARLNSIRYDASGLSRIIFYKDGMKIFSRNWLLGGGGGAWEYLYRQYQSYNYGSTQAHNYLLQLGIETGIFGLVILLLLILILVGYTIKNGQKCNTRVAQSTIDKNSEVSERDLPNLFLTASITAAIAALFLHSCIDFDFSEASMLFLFWQLISLLNSEFRNELICIRIIPLLKTAQKVKKNVKINQSGILFIVINVIIAIILLTFTTNFIQASKYSKIAFKNLQENKVEEAISNIKRSIEKDKYNEKYVIGYNPVSKSSAMKAGLADLLLIKSELLNKREENGEKIAQSELTQFQRQFADLNKYIMEIENKTGNNLDLSYNLAHFYFSIGQIEKGLAYLENCLKLYPLEPAIWETKVGLFYKLFGQHFNAGEYENAKKYLTSALNVIQEASITNKKNMNPFLFSDETVYKLQILQFIYKNWENNNELIKLNEVKHYLVPQMDINLDTNPDQWISDNIDVIKMNNTDEGISVKATGESFIFTRYPIKLERGKNYYIELVTDRELDGLFYEIEGVVRKTALQAERQNKYISKFIVESEPKEKRNQLWIHLESDCTIKSIVVIEEN